jgi:ankyrin repeat protein
MCQFLLDNGANVDQLASGAHSPLYVAAQNGHAEVATILLDSGATVNLSTAAG